MGLAHGALAVANGILDRRLVRIAVKIHRHAVHLHVEQVVDFVFVKEHAEIDGADAGQVRLFAGQVQAQVGQAVLKVEAVGQFHGFRQAGRADLNEPISLVS